MKDGSFRAVIACKSINFDLMSNNEREGIEYSYQNFLNSLNFPIQVLIRSQRVDIGPYLNSLAELRRNEDNMLLGRLMDYYIDFIDVLSQEANIMDKSFFIIIPYYTSPELAKAAVACNTDGLIIEHARTRHALLQLQQPRYCSSSTTRRLQQTRPPICT